MEEKIQPSFDFVAYSRQLRELSGAVLKPLEAKYLKPFRETQKPDPLMGRESAQALIDGLFATYAIAAFATLDLLRAFDPHNAPSAVVVPSLRLYLVPRSSTSSRHVLTRTKRRFQLVDLSSEDKNRFWYSDSYALDTSRMTSDFIITELVNKIKMAEDIERDETGEISEFMLVATKELFENRLLSNCATRTHLLTDRSFLGQFARLGAFTTADYFTFTGNPAGEAIVFLADVAFSQKESWHDHVVTLPLSGNLGTVESHAREKLSQNNGHGMSQALLQRLGSYLTWVRIALGVEVSKEEDEAANDFGITLELRNEGSFNSALHKCVVALSCFDPVIGRSDGTHILYLERPPSPILLEALHELVVPVLTRFGRLDEALHDYDRIRNHAMRSTVSGILARSMAHDIGSHMLAGMKLETEDSQVLADFEYLGTYLRRRMVWIAEATTSEPFWSMPLRLIKDVLRPLVQFHFTEGASEVLRKSPVVRYLARDREVDSVTVIIHYPETGCRFTLGEAHAGQESEPPDISVSIPTGLVGVQALYAILENVIRNAAKYGNKEMNPGSRNLGLHLRLDKLTLRPDLMRVRVWDERSQYSDEDFSTIRALCAPTEDSDWRQPNPKWPFVDASGEYFREGWGIKEMRAAAAWLRGGPLLALLRREELQENGSNEQPPLFRACVLDSDGNEKMLGERLRNHLMGYEFYLLRPRIFYIVWPSLLEKIKQHNSATVDNLRRVGVVIVDELDLSAAGEFETVFVDFGLSHDPAEVVRAIDEQRNSLPLRLAAANLPEGCASPMNTAVLGVQQLAELGAQLEQGAFPALALAATERLWLKGAIERENNPDGAAPPILVLNLLSDAGTNEKKAIPDRVSQTAITRWEQVGDSLRKSLEDWPVRVPRTQTELGAVINTEKSQICLVSHHRAPLPQWEGEARFDNWRGRWEFRSATSIHSMLFEAPLDARSSQMSLWRLFEAMLATVFVVDERLYQQWSPYKPGLSSKEKKDRLRQLAVLEDLGIRIPGFAYEAPDQQALSDLRKTLKGLSNRPFALLIHRGLIEEGVKSEEFLSFLERWVDSLLSEQLVAAVVFMSDRGADAAFLPKRVRFLPFLPVETAIRAQDKLQLVQLIHSSRRPAGRENEKNYSSY